MIWERVMNALDGLGLPVAANMMLTDSGTALPDAYLVYTLIASVPVQHGDDVEAIREDFVQVSYYCTTGLTGMPDVETAMTAAGFIAGRRTELPYNPSTGHYGLAMEYSVLEV